MGSHGDIHPFIALAQGVAVSGGQAAIITNPHFGPLLREQNVHLYAAGEALSIRAVVQDFKHSMDPMRGPMVVLKQLVLPLLPIYHRVLRDAIREFKPHIVVSHPLCIGNSWVCEQAGVPHAVAGLSPCLWMNPNDMIAMTPFRSYRPSRFAVRLDILLGRLVMGLILDGPLNRIRRDMGLPKMRAIFHHEATGGVVSLGLWSPHFRGDLPADPSTGRICGFPWFDRDASQEGDLAALWKFVEDGPPPIVLTLGTAVVHAQPKFYEIAARACAMLNRRGVLLVGSRDYTPRDIPENVRCFPYAPFSRLFPMAAAVVHHGGIGTTGQAMRAGVPSVVVPAAHDQFDNAARVKRLGVSETLHLNRATPESLAEALRLVIDEPGYRARAAAIGVKVTAEDGVGEAVKALGDCV